MPSTSRAVAAMMLLFGVAHAQSPDVAKLYEKKPTWQGTWQAATQALAKLEAEESTARAALPGPEGVSLGQWYVIGSFDNTDRKGFATAFPPEKEIGFAQTYPAMQNTEAKWRTGIPFIDGQVNDLLPHFRVTEGAICYLYRLITAKQAVEVPAYLGSDDGLKTWLDGEEIVSQDVPRGCGPDQVVVKLKLRPGDNPFMMKIVNQTGGWAFYFSLKPYAGANGEAPEHGRRVGELWSLVQRDFGDEKSHSEMDAETGDGIWSPHGSLLDEGALAARYDQAARAKLDEAKRYVAWLAQDFPDRRVDANQATVTSLADAIATADDVPTRRATYYRARLLDHVTQAQYRLVCASLAIKDLSATYPDQYTRGPEFAKSADDLLRRGDTLLTGEPNAAAIADWEGASISLQQEALVKANPLLASQKLLFVRRKGPWGLPQNWQGDSSIARLGYDTAISTLSPIEPRGALSEVFARQGPFIGDLDLSFEGDRMLFSMVATDGPQVFSIYEVRTDGTGLRQVTTSPYPDIDDYDACYLPDGDLIFCSTRSYGAVPCTGGDHVGLLYRCDSQGRNVRQLTFDQDHSWHPTVLPDGRVLYTRWEYNDTPHYFSRILFGMNPDGTEQMAYYASNSYFPNSMFYTRPLPGSSTRLVSILSGHHGNPRMGEVALVDLNRGSREAEGMIQLLPQKHRVIDAPIIDQYATGEWPQFVCPYPLSDKYFLVSCKPDPSAPWGIYLVDVFDNLVPILVQPDASLFEPMLLRSRPRPALIPSRVNYRKTDALVRLEDIYRGPGLQGVPRGTIKRLRIGEPIYRYWGNGDQYSCSMDGTWDVKRIWGTVPVYPDGSALFRVPANTPLFVQPLDEHNMALQQMRSWFTAMPGEHLACVGCHEPRGDVPPTTQTEATKAGPSDITPWYGPPRGFSFEAEAQPILTAKCVTCHGEGKSLDLRGKSAAPDRKYSLAYDALHPYVRRAGLESDIHMLPPMEFVAPTSKLVQLLQKGHEGVTLTGEEWDRLITWIDLNVPFAGDWNETPQKPPAEYVARREEMRQADAAARAALVAAR